MSQADNEKKMELTGLLNIFVCGIERKLETKYHSTAHGDWRASSRFLRL